MKKDFLTLHKVYIFSVFIILLSINQSFSQLNFLREDFVGNTERKWWRWHNDPNATIATTSVSNGYSFFALNNPIINTNPPYYCDAALWDGEPDVGGPYMYVTITLRAKALTDHYDGSRGWGLWYTEGNPPGVVEQIWFMQSVDSTGLTNENWWRAEKTKGPNDIYHDYTDLDSLETPIDIKEWHTYTIIRQADFVEMKIDNETVLYTDQNLPENTMAFHYWIDNLVYEFDSGVVNVYQRAWTGTNQTIFDYVEINTGVSIDSTETPSGIKILREIPSEIYKSETQQLWKDYFFDSPGGNLVFLFTGRAEYYQGESAPYDGDDIRFIIDGTDYGWKSSDSFDGATQGTHSKTLLIEQNVAAGTSKNLEIYAETSPLLYDATILGSSNGGIIVDNEYNEISSQLNDELWKQIDFYTSGGEVAIYVSGSADEDPNPTNYGYQYSDFNDAFDDELKIILNSDDFGYKNDTSFWGNRLFGEPKSVLFVKNLNEGNHSLQIWGKGTPTLHRVVIYGENDDNPLPVTLNSFDIEIENNANKLTWTTASEINNLGFNIYRKVSDMDLTTESNFIKINDQLIKGAGNSSVQNSYSFSDTEVKNNQYFWYRIEDIDYKGNKNVSDIKKVFRNEFISNSFELFQNFPNPFNAQTNIPFYLDQESIITYTIINSLGKVIEQSTEFYSAGQHQISWKGNNLPSGVYYFKLSDLKEEKIQKILLLK